MSSYTGRGSKLDRTALALLAAASDPSAYDVCYASFPVHSTLSAEVTTATRLTFSAPSLWPGCRLPYPYCCATWSFMRLCRAQSVPHQRSTAVGQQSSIKPDQPPSFGQVSLVCSRLQSCPSKLRFSLHHLLTLNSLPDNLGDSLSRPAPVSRNTRPHSRERRLPDRSILPLEQQRKADRKLLQTASNAVLPSRSTSTRCNKPNGFPIPVAI